MPRYYFIVRWPDREHSDPHGTELPDPAAADVYARRIIRELTEDGGYDDPDLLMVVRDAAGKTIHSLPFAGNFNRVH